MKKVMIPVACGLSLLLIVVLVALPGKSRYRGTAAGPHDPGKRVAPLVQTDSTSASSCDPAAPPEWNLVNKDSDKDGKDPTRAYWSLEVMAFKANPLRKEAAVQAVAALRKGGTEAWYYHGETTSSVCVGAWPTGAVKSDDGQAAGQGGALKMHDAPDHHGVHVIAWTGLKDDQLKACVMRFPWHATNYQIDRQKGPDGKMHEKASYLIVIPRAPWRATG